MATLKDLLPKSISELTQEELHERLRQLRHSRRTPKISTEKRQAKKAEKVRKEAVTFDSSSLSPDVVARLLAELEGEE